ncbi:MAG: glycosyl transferase family protein [candidate division TM6 bacterium GW2011_GWF2_28_16]|nr:MAG: glycosyl transferase family protein [candidate division TM6 bacterium GW2011_GWF2_28_16]
MVCTDSSEYIAISKSIYNNCEIKKEDGDFNFRRLPGYPAFLSLCYKLLGQDNIKKALYIQVFLASFIPILIFILSLVIFPNNLLLAQLSAIFSLFNLGFYVYSGVVLSDILFLILFLIFLILFYKNKYFLSGVILGLASLVRPVGVYLIIIISIIIILFKKFNFKLKIKNIFKIFIPWVLIISPWLLRNFLLTGALFFHTLPGIHFLIYTAAYIKSDIEKIEYYEAKNILLNKWEHDNQKAGLLENNINYDIKSCNIAENITKKYILNNKILFLKYSLINIFKTIFSLHSGTLIYWDSQELPNYTSKTSFLDKIKRFLFPKINNKFLYFIIYLEILFLFLLLLGFSLFILKILYYKKNLNLILNILLFVLLFVSITLAYGCARLRLPVEIFLILFAVSYWLENFNNILKKLKFKNNKKGA